MPQPGVRQRGHQGHVELSSFCSLLGRLDAAPAPTGLDGGEADHGEDIAGEGAGLALGFRKTSSPSFSEARTPGSRQGDSSFAHSWAFEMADVASRRVAIVAPALARAAR